MGFLDSPLVRGAARSFGNTARANLAAEAQILAQLKSQKESTRGPITTIINNVALPPDVDRETAISEMMELGLNPNTWRKVADESVLSGMQKDNFLFVPDDEGAPGVKLGDTGYRLSIPSLKPKTTGKVTESELDARALEKWRVVVNSYANKNLSPSELYSEAWGDLKVSEQERIYEKVYGSGATWELDTKLAEKLDLIARERSNNVFGYTGATKITSEGYRYLKLLYKDTDYLPQIQKASSSLEGEGGKIIVVNNKRIFLTTLLENSPAVTDLKQKLLLGAARGDFKASAFINEAEKKKDIDLEEMNKARSNEIPTTVAVGEDYLGITSEVIPKDIPDNLKSEMNTTYSPMIIQEVLKRPENDKLEARTVIEDISNNLAKDYKVAYEAIYAILWSNWNLFLDQQEKVE